MDSKWHRIESCPMGRLSCLWFWISLQACTTQIPILESNILPLLTAQCSADTGSTWTPKFADRDWKSVAMSADRMIQTAVTSNELVYLSTDAGETWSSKASSREWSAVAMSADGMIQTAVERVKDGEPGSIFVSTDMGDNWAPRGPSSYWYGIAMSADGVIQTAVGMDGIFVSTDSGVTWSAREAELAGTLVDVAMSADGMIQSAADNFGGRIYLSYPSIEVEMKMVSIGTLDGCANLDVHGNATIHGDLTVTGSCTGCSSDRALKHNIQPLVDALDKIKSLGGVSYDWVPGTRNALYDPGRQIGVIAQDVEQVFPEIVGIDSRGYKYVDYQKLVVPLIEGMKQQQVQIEVQRAEFIKRQAELEAKIETLEVLLN